VEPLSRSVPDNVNDVGMMVVVDPEPITGHAPSVILEFMVDDDATFGDERTQDSG
jgi:hypothetical protein